MLVVYWHYHPLIYDFENTHYPLKKVLYNFKFPCNGIRTSQKQIVDCGQRFALLLKLHQGYKLMIQSHFCRNTLKIQKHKN